MTYVSHFSKMGIYGVSDMSQYSLTVLTHLDVREIDISLQNKN
ncbi:MAG: hypothetical protein ACFFG0_30805 [Candidatus Thorarchaeota archaeon]